MMLPTSIVINLRRPVTHGPLTVRALVMRPANPSDRPAIAMDVRPKEAGIRFAAHLCDVPDAVIRRLGLRDGARVAEALNFQILGVARGR